MGIVHNKIGSKERLYEMFQKVNKTVIKENFDSPAEKDEKYLNKGGDEKAFNNQPNKYDHINEDEFGDDDVETMTTKSKDRDANAFKDMLMQKYGTDNLNDLTPLQRQEIMKSMDLATKKQRKISGVGGDMTDDEREMWKMNDRKVLNFLAKNATKVRDMSTYDRLSSAYQQATNEPMPHPMAILASISRIDPYTELRQQLKPIEDLLVSQTDRPDRARKEMGNVEEGEELNELSWNDVKNVGAGLKNMGKDAANALGNKFNSVKNAIGSAVNNATNTVVSSYYKGARNSMVGQLEEMAQKFGKEFGEMFQKLNNAVVRSGDEPLTTKDIQSLTTKFAHAMSQYARVGNVGTFNVSNLRKEQIGEDEIQGGLADEKEPNQFDAQQILKGMEVEMEHTNDPKIALEIAMDHLQEIPDYYDHLDQMEKEASSEEDGSDDFSEDDRSADSLLYPSEHWVDHYEMKNVGEAFGFDPEPAPDFEAGVERYDQKQQLKKDVAVDDMKLNYDGKGNFIPQGMEDKRVGIRPVEQPMGSDNWKYIVVQLTSNGDIERTLNSKDTWDEAKLALIDSVS